MQLNTGLHLRQTQSLKLAPQIIQSIEILQLPTLALEEFLRQEMLSNPALELVEGGQGDDSFTPEGSPENPDAFGASGGSGEGGGEGGPGEAFAELAAPSEPQERVGDGGSGEGGGDVDGVPSFDALSAELERFGDNDTSWRESGGMGGGGGGGDEDKKLEALQNTAARDGSLQYHVFDQLALAVADERDRAIGEHLIYNLDSTTGWLGRRDDQGHFTPYADDELAQGVEPPCTPEDVRRVLAIIQGLEPPGIGARSLKECLLIQLGRGRSLERRLIEHHLDDLLKNRIPKVAKAVGKSIEEVNEALRLIATLNPYPGSTISAPPTSYVVPDVVCELVDGRYEVRLNDRYLPRIHVSPQYRLMLERQRENRAVRDYIKKKIEQAKWLMDAIEQRQSTLLKIAREVVNIQKDFLDKGIDALKPLKMQEIGDKVGVHVSTVSRAIAEKWMQTPRGMFALRYFFTGGTTNKEGEEESVLAVKQKVRDVVDKEDKACPLSDDEIADELKKLGYDVARRTITKYRKQLDIPASRERRQYH